MSKRIVVNAGLIETRVAVQEGNLLTELYLERRRHRSIVGSVVSAEHTGVLSRKEREEARIKRLPRQAKLKLVQDTRQPVVKSQPDRPIDVA